MEKRCISVRISLRSTGAVLAEGIKGWDMMPFEGNFYIRRRCLKTEHFRLSFVPSICPYKGLYVWMNLLLPDTKPEKSIAWYYWLPNPLFPFIWFRVALPGSHPNLVVEQSS